MNDLNVITLTGEIASDIKTGTTKNNQSYAFFRLHSLSCPRQKYRPYQPIWINSPTNPYEYEQPIWVNKIILPTLLRLRYEG